MTGTEWDVSVGDVGEDGMWRLRLNEFAHVLKLASQVPNSVEGELDRRLDKLPYTARQVCARTARLELEVSISSSSLYVEQGDPALFYRGAER